MMKFASSLTLFAAAAVASVHADDSDVAKEDGTFWNRYLQDVDSFPTPAPTTGTCDVTFEFDCTHVPTGIPCVDIPNEDQPKCTCPECVREVIFTYTGTGCTGNELECTDFVDAPHPSPARVTICAGEDGTLCPFEGSVAIGETITISSTECLPASMVATVASGPGLLLQTVAVDTACVTGSDSVVLKDTYGAFQFVGYSCDESNTHICIEEVTYDLEVCNIGIRDEFLYEFFVDVNGVVSDLLLNVTDSELLLAPEECFSSTETMMIDRCQDIEYIAMGVANLTNPETGPPCEKQEEITFDFAVGTLPPIAPPTPAPIGKSSSCFLSLSL
jgi:hypothetical protein